MGRPKLGERDHFSVRPTVEVGRRVREEAKKAGLSQGELISRILADRYSLPYAGEATVHQLDNQTTLELPMTG